MSIKPQVLGQSAPAAATPTIVYDCPAASIAEVSSIIACNRGATTDAIRVSVSINGGVTANKDYIYYDLPLSANDTFAAEIGVALSATDLVRVYSTTGNTSFTLFGSRTYPA